MNNKLPFKLSLQLSDEFSLNKQSNLVSFLQLTFSSNEKKNIYLRLNCFMLYLNVNRTCMQEKIDKLITI